VKDKKNLLFVNTNAAQCSIYQSGKMIYESIKDTDSLNIEYCELNDLNIDKLYSGKIVINQQEKSNYEYYIFNYHHATMRGFENIKSENFKNLVGKKYSIILEMSKNNPTVRLESDDFDGYIVMDPTMQYLDNRFHWFPRPLDITNANQNNVVSDIPIIGSFGYPTVDKGFDLVIKAASKEFEKSIVRINIPTATYGDNEVYSQIINSCRSIYAPNVKLEITTNFFSDKELLEWCSNNTLNCFFYHRNSYIEFPGLAAATDQAIISGRPLAVSTDVTFRHLHQYITPYPQRSLKESIQISADEVKKIQQNWNFEKCQQRLKEILI